MFLTEFHVGIFFPFKHLFLTYSIFLFHCRGFQYSIEYRDAPLPPAYYLNMNLLVQINRIRESLKQGLFTNPWKTSFYKADVPFHCPFGVCLIKEEF